MADQQPPPQGPEADAPVPAEEVPEAVLPPEPQATSAIEADPSAEAADPIAPSEEGPDALHRWGRWLLEWVAIIVVAALAAVVVRTYVVQTYYVPSGSMMNTLQVGDRILVNKLAYDFHPIHRGDIVVFKTPGTENCPGPPVANLVKRVIGLPGETLKSSGNTVLFREPGSKIFKPLAEPWLDGNAMAEPLGTPISPPITMRSNQYFMMGDNRADSCDSRSWGPITSNLVVGEVQLIIWPLSQAGHPG